MLYFACLEQNEHQEVSNHNQQEGEPTSKPTPGNFTK
jgi:hypothetical protein